MRFTNLGPAFWIIFWVLIAACLPVLVFWVRRHRDPRFRPRVGEVFLVSLIMLMGSSTAAYFLRGIFSADDFARDARSGPGFDTPETYSDPGDDDDGER